MVWGIDLFSRERFLEGGRGGKLPLLSFKERAARVCLPSRLLLGSRCCVVDPQASHTMKNMEVSLNAKVPGLLLVVGVPGMPSEP
jgi:hypothetical protein